MAKKNGTTAVAKREPRAFDLISEALTKRSRTIAALLPEVVRPELERFMNRALLTWANDPKLQICTPQSFVTAVITGAEVGLPIDGKLGYAIPYENKALSKREKRLVKEAKFMPSYVGLIQIAKRSGQIKNAFTDLIYSEDDFRYGRMGDKAVLEHWPALDSRGDVRGAYAVITFPDGTWVAEVMNFDQLMAVRARSKAKDNDAPWQTFPGEMMRKSVLKRGLKTYCSDPGFIQALRLDDSVSGLDVSSTVPEDSHRRRTRASDAVVPGVFDSMSPGGPEAAAAPDGSDDPQPVPEGDTGESGGPEGLFSQYQDLFDELSSRLDNSNAAECVQVCEWARENFPEMLHGTVQEMVDGRLLELGTAAKRDGRD